MSPIAMQRWDSFLFLSLMVKRLYLKGHTVCVASPGFEVTPSAPAFSFSVVSPVQHPFLPLLVRGASRAVALRVWIVLGPVDGRPPGLPLSSDDGFPPNTILSFGLLSVRPSPFVEHP